MFTKNAKLIENKLLPFIKELEEVRQNKQIEQYGLLETKVGVPTLQIEQNGRALFLHSKYNPLQEAERVVQENKTAIAEKEYILFLGVGLGYHIEKIMEQFPTKHFILIEPNPAIFVRFLESRPLHNFPFKQMSTLFLPSEEFPLGNYLTSLSIELKGDASIVIFPAYERLFKDEVNNFYRLYKEALKTTKSNTLATQAFGKRWTLNSLLNMPTTLSTQNIKEKAKYFKGKPIIIASAGPALNEDLEQLKYIQEQKLAYIFAVGSANKALISHGITPNAVLTYDPQPHNVNVFKELIASGRTDIPMIYGTSVGFETIETYQGPKYHLVNSADSVTNFYLNHGANTFDVSDSATITLIAIQVAELLNAESIILAGQNLAFKGNRYYATGIEHGKWKGEVREDKEGKEIQTTRDVYGNLVETNESLLGMKEDIELYLNLHPHLQVINTTKGGADIRGTSFEPIEQVIQERLTKKVVDEQWFIGEQQVIQEQTIKQVQKMEHSINQMYESLDTCRTILQRLDSLKRTNKVQQINKLFTEFDKQFDRLMTNDFYTCFIASILQYEVDHLNKTIQKSYVEEQINRIDIITSANMLYLGMVQEIFSEMVVHVKEIVHPKIFAQSTNWKMYNHNDGVFHYEGNWERETVTFHDLSHSKKVRKISRTISTMSVDEGASITFKFEGTALQLFAQTHEDFSNDVKVIIDGKEQMIKTKNHKLKDGLSPKLQQTVFEVKALQDKMHEVSIELGSNEPFHFQGVAINPNGRIYHVDEVSTVAELEVGKRIRCHYEATINKIGTFSKLGATNNPFIPVEATPQPKGDFYFIMVDDTEGEQKLIADRNVQNYISFNRLVDGLKKKSINGYSKSVVRLINVSEENQELDEWLIYLHYLNINGVLKSNDQITWNHARNVDVGTGLYSFISYENGEAGVYSKLYHAEQKVANENKHVKVSLDNKHRLWGFRPVATVWYE